MGSLDVDKFSAGMGAKPDDRWSVPLCVMCHLDGRSSLHRIGEEVFWKRTGIDPFSVAEKLYSEFKSTRDRKDEEADAVGASKPKRKQKSSIVATSGWTSINSRAGPKRKMASRPFPPKGSRKMRGKPCRAAR